MGGGVEVTEPKRYRLADGCRKCGRRERRRVFAWTLELFAKMDPDAPVEEVWCRCGASRWVKAAAYHGATLDRPKGGG